MFSGKIRSYLRFKGIPFVEKAPSLYNFMVTTRRRAGNPVMPMLVDPDGQWISDTSDMIDILERRYPAAPVVPSTPRQKMAAYLFELWGDEFWVSTALHTRWSHPEHYAQWEHEAGLMLPGLPMWLRRFITGSVARPMFRKYLPPMGVVPENFEAIDRWTVSQLDMLDRHFAAHPFLLGERPSLGDFGLFVVTYGHLSLDEWSVRNLIEPHPHVAAWLKRMNHPKPLEGTFLPGDDIPDTLSVLLREMLSDMLPYLEATLAEVRAVMPKYANERFPRMLGNVEQPMGTGSNRGIQRTALPYTLWMVQRMMDAYRAMPAEDASAVRAWLVSLGGEKLLDLDIPRLRRAGLQAALDRQAA
jgi:glutathione S-transferase